MTIPAVSSAERAPLKLASWNLKSCERGLTAIIRGLRSLDADIVALQEVERRTFRSGGMDQAAFLAKESGYAFHHFFKARDCGPGEYGLALLSKHPLTDFRRMPLPVPPKLQQRVLGSAVALLPWGRLSVHVTHLTHVFHARRLRLYQEELFQAQSGQPVKPVASLVITKQPFPCTVKQSKSVDDPVDVVLITGAKSEIQAMGQVKAELINKREDQKQRTKELVKLNEEIKEERRPGSGDP
ncbi:MAG: endonuclease/exonuclease/phosphatase family protein, partial [Myxococcales bacterium]